MGPRWIRGFLTFLCSLLVSLVEAWSTSFRRRQPIPVFDLIRSSSPSCSRVPPRATAKSRQTFVLNYFSDQISGGNHCNEDYHNQAQVFLVQTSNPSEDNAAAAQQHRDSNGTPLGRHHAANDRGSDPIIQFLPIEISSGEKSSSSSTTAVDVTRQAAIETWNWCANFVARHNLCPWAGASVREPCAIRLYGWVDPPPEEPLLLEAVLERVATDFVHDLEDRPERTLDPNTAIAFVLLLSSSSSSSAQSSQHIQSSRDDDNSWWYSDFASFYDLFFELEEQWPMQEKVTLAPFHPKWKYFGEEEVENLELEKQSPHVTISLVSTATIDKAGEAATKQIAANNQNVLQQKSAAEWRRIHEHAVHSSARSIDDDDEEKERSFQ